MPMAPQSDSDSDIVEFTCRRGKNRPTATTTPTPTPTTTTPVTAAAAAAKRRKKSGSSIRGRISPLSSSVAAHSTVSSVSLQSTLEEEENNNNNNNHNKKKKSRVPISARFIGAPLSLAQAQVAFPSHYLNNRFQQGGGICDRQNDQKSPINEGVFRQQDVWGRCVAHYLQAEVDGRAYKLGDCASLNTGDGPDFIGQILEFFEIDDGSSWFLAQRFFKAHDTAIGEVEAKNHDIKRVFYSEVKDVSPLDCLVSKLKIVQVSPLNHFNKLNLKAIASCDYYYDMGYDHAYSRFYKLPFDAEANSSDLDVTVSNDTPIANGRSEKNSKNEARSGMDLTKKEELCLLDLYSGCGGMSTGLCMGASLSGLNLVTKWAIDLNEHACKSLKFNHPETKVRNESAEDFLHLLKDWEQLCKKYCHKEDGDGQKANACSYTRSSGSAFQGDDGQLLVDIDEDEYAVEKIVGIRFMGSNSSSKKSGLQLKAHWKGYGLTQDSWEPIEGLRGCEGAVKKFVIDGNNTRILPLPGDVDVVCGGPPCQGASGFNRFRNQEDPLADERNKQIVVYMDIVNYLKSRFVLMENVVDILKFAGGTLGRYALSCLVKMHYQAKLGLMVAGCYGLPQFRMRVFLWGASPLENLPPYPLPTHDVVQKRGIPQEWERNVVAYNETQRPKLAKALTLGDALSDLPPVKNSEHRDEMPYDYKVTNTKFQRFIRLPKQVLIDPNTKPLCQKHSFVVYDHRPFELNADDYQRTCRIPKQKGANFRNLPGVLVRADNTVAIDPSKKRILLPSGKPLVPDYAITFVNGRSSKPFGRLWWDETVPTVVTRAEPHNQIILHPEQDRVLTIRENARLQGFPDYYKLFGPVKERYIQVGNAVAVPVSRALGYTLGLALQSLVSSGTVTELPDNFPHSLMSSNQQLTTTDITF